MGRWAAARGRGCGVEHRQWLATGYEQARSVVAVLDDDWDAARGVRLNLPEPGVCHSVRPDRDARSRQLRTAVRSTL